MTSTNGKSTTIQEIEAELNTMFLERETAVRYTLATLLAKQSIVLLGPAGAGKTALIEETAGRFTNETGQGLQFFSHLMTKFTEPDELFGPVAFSSMKADQILRVTTDMLPEAEIVFLDEIWKPSSSILNTLLKIVDQRIFKNGAAWKDTPIMAIYGASNELPEGNDLVAIRDRMLITYQVQYLSESGFKTLMRRKAGLDADPFKFPKTKMTRQELVALQERVKTIAFTEAAVEGLCNIRIDLLDVGITVSDRRNGYCLQLMAADAVLNGQQEVTQENLEILTDSMWIEPAEAATCARIVRSHGNPLVAMAMDLKDQADDIYQQAIKQIKELSADSTKKGERASVAAEASGKLKNTCMDISKLLTQAKGAGQKTEKIDRALKSAQEQNRSLLKSMGVNFNV